MKSRLGAGSKRFLPALVLCAAVAWWFAPLLAGRAIVAEPDALAALLPLKAFLARALAAGEWPLWNPDAALGKPFLPDLLAGALYPGNLLLAVEPFWRGLNLLFVVHYAWTALGAWLWLRASGLPRLAALLGAVVWTFGGTMVSLGNVLNQLLSAAWLPWVLWAWLRPRALGAKVALSSLAMGMALLAGGPEMVLVSAAALVLTSRHPASLAVPPLAFALAAVELLPFAHYLTETWRGAFGFEAATAMRYSVPPADLAQLALPWWTPSPERFMPQIYVGPAVLALALIGVLASRAGRLYWGPVALGALLVVMGSHTPVYPFLHAYVPLSSLLRYPEKLFLGVHALVAAGAAVGLAALAALARRHGFGRAATLVGVAVVAGVFADLVRANRDALYAPAPAAILEPPAAARAIVADAAAGRAGASAEAADRSAPRIFANPRGRFIPRSLAAAVALDRNLPWGAVAELYGLANVNAPSSLNLVKHERLQETLAAVPRDQALRVLAALGTQYVTSFVWLDGAPGVRSLPVEGEAIGVRAYALDDARPRAFVTRRIETAPDAARALERFVAAAGAGGEDVAVLEEGGVASLGRQAPPRGVAPAGGRDAVRIARERQSELVLEVALERDGLLVVSDTFLAGWRASVDGADAPLLEVNGLVRGVWLRAGSHRVVMRYVPPGLLAGAGVSVLALALIGVLARRAPRMVASRPADAAARGALGEPRRAATDVDAGRPHLPAPTS
ncbi:MAG: YfhO family protein [Thermodesulfobacteriota bacterium]